MAVSRVAAFLLGCSLIAVSPAPCEAALTLPNGSLWGLKNAYNGTFKFGVSTLKNSIFKKEPTKTLIKENYDVLLTETDLIWSSVEYQDGQWYWKDVDDYVEWAIANDMEPIGHCLLWKGIGWMSYYPDDISEKERYDLFMTRIEDWIRTAMTRYRDRVKRWVVVNEWFNLTGQIRQDYIMPVTLGMDGVSSALGWAQKYGTPDMKFYFSENSLYIPTKAQPVMKAYRKLRKAGYKIDGVFLQGHMYQNSGVVKDTTGPHTHSSPKEYDVAFKTFGKNGFEIVFSEWDITSLPDGWSCCRNTSLYDYPPEQQAALNPYADGLPPKIETQLRKKWSAIMRVLLKNKQYITDVHFWGLTDNLSWFNKWPINPRVDYPTLFDRNNTPKAAYYDLLRMAPNQPPAGVVIPDYPYPEITGPPVKTTYYNFSTTANSLATKPPAGIKQIPTTAMTTAAAPTMTPTTIASAAPSPASAPAAQGSAASVVVVTATRTTTVTPTQSRSTPAPSRSMPASAATAATPAVGAIWPPQN